MRATHETMATRPTKSTRPCAVCGTPFPASPSDRRKCCAPECGSILRARNRTGNTRGWSAEAKARKSASPVPDALQWGAAYARAKVITDPSSHPDAKAWRIIAPDKTRHEVTNLRRWLINRLGEREGVRVYDGLRQVAKALRLGKSSPTHAHHWQLADLPDDQARP